MEHLPLGKQSDLITGKAEAIQYLALSELNSPQYLFDNSHYRACLDRLKSHGGIALFLDFDGTLVPIRKDPACCILSEETKELLQFLANSRYCYLAIISGRSLSDIKGRVGLRRVFYGGNHGLDIRAPRHSVAVH